MDKIEVDETEAFVHARNELAATASDFDTKVTAARSVPARVDESGLMEEGNSFSRTEGAAREMLHQYMANTSRGLLGYTNATGNIGNEYTGLVGVTEATMNRLLQPASGPATVGTSYAPAPTGGN